MSVFDSYSSVFSKEGFTEVVSSQCWRQLPLPQDVEIINTVNASGNNSILGPLLIGSERLSK